MRRVLAAYVGLGLLLVPVPLLNVLQVESAAVVALVSFFVAGRAAVGSFRDGGASWGRVLLWHEAALLVPLCVLLVAQMGAPTCTVGQGVLFYALFPGVTVVLAVSLAYALQGLGVPRPGLVLGGVGGALVVAGPLYDLGLHPQFYTYNHVFGGVLGPIYDEQLAVRPGLFVFRGLTLLWAGVAVLVGRWARGRRHPWGLLLCAGAIATVYAYAAPLGINTPAWYLQKHLKGHTRTAHFDLYYDPAQVDASAAQALAQAHEARYAWIRDRLGASPKGTGRRVQSYIYPNPDVKGRLTGARTTSVSPVWLATPQVHLLRSEVSRSLGHELAHVASRAYGLPGLKASWAPGVVEGWAVALEPPSAAPSPDDLVRTAAATDTTTSLRAEARAIADRLSPWGFWTGRGAVSYATMGSFVAFLLDRYGPERLTRVYAWGNFEEVYDRSLRRLAREWAAHLRRASAVDRDAHAVVTRRFTRPSLFEADCPHHVPPAQRHLQRARRAARQRDTTRMVRHLDRALALRPRFPAAHERRARIRLARGRWKAVQTQLDTLANSRRSPHLHAVLADARALGGDVDGARALYATARAHLPGYAHGARTRLLLRDAVADRPAVIRVLVGGDSAAVQARRLESGPEAAPAVQAWRGVRWMDAHRHSAALSVWEGLRQRPTRGDRPRGWHRAWRLQHAAWAARAAKNAGAGAAARRWAQRAARQAQTLGDEGRAARFEWWAAEANPRQAAPRSDPAHPEASPPESRLPPALRVQNPDHVPRLLVGARSPYTALASSLGSNAASSGPCTP